MARRLALCQINGASMSPEGIDVDSIDRGVYWFISAIAWRIGASEALSSPVKG